MAEAAVSLIGMNEAQLRQWVDENPKRVNTRDRLGCTPLYVAVYYVNGLELTEWLLDEKGADVNIRNSGGCVPIHATRSVDILRA